MAKLTAKHSEWKKIPGDPDGAELKILHLKPGEVQRIQAETSSWVGRAVNDQFENELHYKPITQARKFRMASLIGWKGFYGENGEQLECNAKNKDLWLDEDPVLGEGAEAKPLSAWIDQFRNEIAAELAPQEEQLEKN